MTHNHQSPFLVSVLPIAITLALVCADHQSHAQEPDAYSGFEARHTHPITLTPDGDRLIAVHSEAASLSVFDVTGPSDTPVKTAQIPVGLEPVSVRARTNTEVWVVNEVSDSITIILLQPDGTGTAAATVATGDEPADVIFANGKAFVSCARFNEIWVHDITTGAVLDTIPLDGVYPTSLASSSSGDRIYACFLHSGNGTTVLPRAAAPDPTDPENPNLPAAPRTTRIVSADDPAIPYTVLDHDLVEIDTATHTVLRYFGELGTNFLGIAVSPDGSAIWASHTEARNLIRFEPALNGKFALNRLARIALPTGVHTPHDLNPGVDLDLLPNPAASAIALSQPSALVFESDGAHLWVAAFASDRVARVSSADGSVTQRVDIRIGGTGESDEMRGPRGLALHQVTDRLYVLNKLSGSLSVIDTRAATPNVVAEMPLSDYEPLPPSVKRGRGYLFDARLSGNGLVSCGTCHLDADRDGLAWDLGDPAGELQTVLGANLSIHDITPRTRVLHPMKGPMVTQTLRGLEGGDPFHWRGDRAEIADFNPTFPKLLGGELLDEDDMADLTTYLMALRHHPNPNRNPDRTLPASFGPGNPIAGRDLFNNHNKSHCVTCHAYPNGSDGNIDLPQETGLSQPVKTATLRTVYQRLFFDPRPGAVSPGGFGLLHDGTGFELPIGHPYVLDNLRTLQELRDVTAFLLCYDTGTAPVVGRGATVTLVNREDQGLLDDLAFFEGRAAAGDCELVVRGRSGGEDRSWLYRPATQDYRSDRSEEGMVARSTLLNALSGSDTLTFLGVPPGQGNRLGGDVDLDGVLDGNDPDPRAYNGAPRIVDEPGDTAVAPAGTLRLEVEFLGTGADLQWFHNSVPLPGQTGAVLEIAGVTNDAAGTYQLAINHPEGDTQSRLITVEVYPAPAIDQQPTDRSIVEGRSTGFSARASGSGLRYQWLRGGQAVAGATSPTLSFRNAQGADAGTYALRVSNGAGSVTSDPVTLTVIQHPVIDTASLPVAIVGQEYTGPLSARNTPTRFAAAALPPGLFVPRGALEISGRARKAGHFPVRLTAFNAAGSSGAPVTVMLEVRPFTEEALGVYEAVLPRDASLNENLGGHLRVVTSRLANHSGILRLGRQRLPFRGNWTVSDGTDPHSTIILKRRNQSDARLELEIDPSTRALTGQLLIDDATLDFSGAGAVSTPGDLAGTHTLALTLPSTSVGDGTVPQGDSFGGFTVDARGMARGALFLADGSRARFAVPVSGDGKFRLFQLLYRGTGSLVGETRIDPAAAHRLGDSELSWSKAPQASGRVYPGGFGPLDLEARGGLYTIPTRGENLAGFDRVSLTFTHGGAPDPATRIDVGEAVFPARHPAPALITTDNPGLVRLTLQTGVGTRFIPGVTGTLAGSFTLIDSDTTLASTPARRRVSVFRGVVVNDGTGHRGYGFFLLPEMPTAGPPPTTLRNSPILSGRVRLEPLP